MEMVLHAALGNPRALDRSQPAENPPTCSSSTAATSDGPINKMVEALWGVFPEISLSSTNKSRYGDLGNIVQNGGLGRLF